MKQFLDYKKQFKFLFFGIFLLIPLVFLHAQTADDLKNQINQKDSDIADLEKEIATYQSQLDVIGKQKDSLNGTLKELDLTKKKLMTDVAVTEKKIDKTNLTINGLSSDIGNKQDAIANNLESIKLEIRETDEFERSGVLDTILSDNDFTTMWNDIDDMVAVREKVRQDITTLKQTKGNLENTRQISIGEKNQLLSLKSQLGDQQKILAQNTAEKNKLLQQTKNTESGYQALLKDRIAKRDAFEKELQDYEAKLQYILDPSKLPAGRVLSWPLANVFVTQLFGKTVDSVRLYASGSHSGVDFRASVGTPVLSMADGVVMGTGDTDTTCYGASFGKFVFIKYDNGLSSTFGHLSLIKATAGEKVTRGEVVGYSGATGHVTGPHLHVSLYVSDAVKMASKPSAACDGRIYTLPVAPVNAYLDALKYLPPYIINSSQLENNTSE